MNRSKRWDKIVIERPRTGGTRQQMAQEHRAKRNSYMDKEDYDSLPSKQRMNPYGRMSYYHSNSKQFSDLIGPLRKWVASQEGQHIDDMMSAMNKMVPNKQTTVGAHIFQHLNWLFVHAHDITMIDGIPYERKWSANGMVLKPLVSWYKYDQKFYVDPNTGILTRAPLERSANKNKKQEIPDKVEWNNKKYFQVNGEWYRDVLVGVRRGSRCISESKELVWNERENKNEWIWTRKYEVVDMPERQSQQLKTKEKRKLLEYLNKKYLGIEPSR